MTVKIKAEVSKYLIIATLEAILKNNKPYKRTYTEQRQNESKNKAEVKAIQLAVRHLNQSQELKLEIIPSSPYIKMCLQSLAKWQQSDWLTGKGKEVKHKAEWQEIYELIKNFELEVKDE